MKRFCLPVWCGIFALIFILSACFNTKQASSNAFAQNFLQKYYTVDAQTVREYQNLNESAENGTISSKEMESVYSKFKDSMEDSEYSRFIADRLYLTNVSCAANKNCVFQKRSVTLTVVQKDENITQYDYDAKITVLMNQTKKQQVISESGSIQVTNHNGNLKISYFRITKSAEFIAKSNL